MYLMNGLPWEAELIERHEARASAARSQADFLVSVVNGDHLIEEEVVPILAHLPDDGEKLAKPDVRLLGRRRVETPLLSGLIVELGERRRVAVCLTEGVRLLVLRYRVENVYRPTHSLHEAGGIWETHGILQKATVGVVKEIAGERSFKMVWECSQEKALVCCMSSGIRRRQTGGTYKGIGGAFCLEKGGSGKNDATGTHDELFVEGPPTC